MRAADFPEHSKKEKKNTLLFLPQLRTRLMKLSLPSYWSAFIVRILMYHTAVARIFQRCFWKRFNFFPSLILFYVRFCLSLKYLLSYHYMSVIIPPPKSSRLHPGSDTRAILRLSCFLSHLIQYTVEFPIEQGWECWVCNKSFFFNWLKSKHLHYLYLKYLLIKLVKSHNVKTWFEAHTGTIWFPSYCRRLPG